MNVSWPGNGRMTSPQSRGEAGVQTCGYVGIGVASGKWWAQVNSFIKKKN